MTFELTLKTTSPGNARLAIPSRTSGVFVYAFEDRAAAESTLAEVFEREAKRRPRRRSLGNGRWILDHPRQRSIYALTVELQEVTKTS